MLTLTRVKQAFLIQKLHLANKNVLKKIDSDSY